MSDDIKRLDELEQFGKAPSYQATYADLVWLISLARKGLNADTLLANADSIHRFCLFHHFCGTECAKDRADRYEKALREIDPLLSQVLERLRINIGNATSKDIERLLRAFAIAREALEKP